MQQQPILPVGRVGPPQPGTPTSSSRTMSLFDKQKYIEDYDFSYCDESSKYEKVAKIGQGTFGEVFKAREKKSNKKFVAMKKVLMDNEKEGFPITALREIRILQLLKHENVVNLIEICRTKATTNNGYRSTFYQGWYIIEDVQVPSSQFGAKIRDLTLGYPTHHTIKIR